MVVAIRHTCILKSVYTSENLKTASTEKNEIRYYFGTWAMKKPFKQAIIDLRFALGLLPLSIASVNKRADHVKTNLTLVVPVHQYRLPCWASLQELVPDISGWKLTEFDFFSPWQLARHAYQVLVVPRCKFHRKELQNCTHQPMFVYKN